MSNRHSSVRRVVVTIALGVTALLGLLSTQAADSPWAVGGSDGNWPQSTGVGE